MIKIIQPIIKKDGVIKNDIESCFDASRDVSHFPHLLGYHCKKYFNDVVKVVRKTKKKN